ncbi:MAG: hypothetical protein QM757_26770 [Paludibaculum sp.]
MHGLFAKVWLSTPFVAALLQSSVPPGHEPTAMWVNWGALGVMAWAFYGLFKKEREQASKDRERSEQRLAELVERCSEALESNSQRLGETKTAMEHVAKIRACPLSEGKKQ